MSSKNDHWSDAYKYPSWEDAFKERTARKRNKYPPGYIIFDESSEMTQEHWKILNSLIRFKKR